MSLTFVQVQAVLHRFKLKSLNITFDFFEVFLLLRAPIITEPFLENANDDDCGEVCFS